MFRRACTGSACLPILWLIRHPRLGARPGTGTAVSAPATSPLLAPVPASSRRPLQRRAPRYFDRLLGKRFRTWGLDLGFWAHRNPSTHAESRTSREGVLRLVESTLRWNREERPAGFESPRGSGFPGRAPQRSEEKSLRGSDLVDRRWRRRSPEAGAGGGASSSDRHSIGDGQRSLCDQLLHACGGRCSCARRPASDGSSRGDGPSAFSCPRAEDAG